MARPRSGPKPAKPPKKYPSRLTGEQIWALENADRRNWRIGIQGGVRIIQLLIGGAIIKWGVVPIAAEFAGEDTNVNANVSIAFGLSMVGVAGFITAWGEYQRRKAGRLDRRGRALAGAVHELRKRLRDHKVDDAISPAAADALRRASDLK